MNKCCFGIVSQQRFCCLQRYRKGAWSIPIHSNSAFAGVNRKKEKPKICDIMRKNKRAVKIISLRYGFYADAEPMNL